MSEWKYDHKATKRLRKQLAKRQVGQVTQGSSGAVLVYRLLPESPALTTSPST